MPGSGGRINLGPELSADIHTHAMNSWDQLTHALESGEVDGAFINTPLAMDLFDAGLDISLLMFTHRGGSQMLANPQVSRMSEFSGKSILIPHPVSIQHMLMHQFLGAKGMVLGSDARSCGVLAEPVPPGLMPEMMAQDHDGDIAACMTAEPFATLAADGASGRRLLSSQDLWQDHPCCGFVARESLVEPYYEEFDALVRLFVESATTLDRHITGEQQIDGATLELAARFLDRPEDATARLLETSGVCYTPELLIPEPGLLEIVQDYMSSTMGVLAGTTDLDAFINPAFVQNAVSEIYS
ncbi:MAG: ABC transporter substrate-binding protein [Desulfobacter sp.]